MPGAVSAAGPCPSAGRPRAASIFSLAYALPAATFPFTYAFPAATFAFTFLLIPSPRG